VREGKTVYLLREKHRISYRKNSTAEQLFQLVSSVGLKRFRNHHDSLDSIFILNQKISLIHQVHQHTHGWSLVLLSEDSDHSLVQRPSCSQLGSSCVCMISLWYYVPTTVKQASINITLIRIEKFFLP